MLSFDDPRWNDLQTFCGQSSDLPDLIRELKNAVGTKQESELWRKICDYFLHQSTVKTSAFAVIPYLVEIIATTSKENKIEYVIDLGFVETYRGRKGYDDVPDFLEGDYKMALEKTRKYSFECLDEISDKFTFRYFLGALASLYKQPKLGDILFCLDSLGEDCPKCGEYVFPIQIEESGFI